MYDDAPVRIICPEEVAILIYDEQLGRHLGRQGPFPFRHNGLIGADDTNTRISAVAQFGIKPRAAFLALIICDLENSALIHLEPRRRAGIASDQVDRRAVRIEIGNQFLEDFSWAALY